MGRGMGMGGLAMPSPENLYQAMAERGQAQEQQLEYLESGEAQRQLQEAQAGFAEAEALGAQQKATAMEANIFAREQVEAKRQEREAERQQYVQGEISKIRDQMNEIQTAEVDPLSWYKHPDGSNNYAKSIIAAIAVGLGAVAQSQRGGPNNALNIINKAIDRDIDAQKTNIKNRRAGANQQMNLLGRMMSVMNNERTAESAARLIADQTALMKINQVVEESKGTMAEARGQVLQAALQGQIDDKKAKLASEIYGQRVQDEGTKYQMQAGQAAAQMKAQAAQAKAAPAAMPPGMEVLDPTRAMPTKDDFKRAKAMVGAQRNVVRMLNDLLRWRESHGYEPLTGPALATANTMLGRVKSAMRKVDESGARLEEAEVEMMGLNFEMGDLGMIKERLTAVRDSVTNKVTDALHPMNIRLSSAATPGARRR